MYTLLFIALYKPSYFLGLPTLVLKAEFVMLKTGTHSAIVIIVYIRAKDYVLGNVILHNKQSNIRLCDNLDIKIIVIISSLL